MARKVWALGGKENKAKAAEMARQGIMLEGFAGHFLEDCFAAGHLVPHALGRIGNKKIGAMAGAQANTWHDLFNALPNGIATTLGNFHGDYSMDGHDLSYVSDAVANSMLEVTKPWFEGASYSGGIVLPVPDVGAIMSDPVAGPLWRAMCDDYSGRKDKLDDMSERRRGKAGLSKYAVYETSGGSQVSKDEVTEGLDDNVFGGERPDDSSDTLDKTRGDVHSIVVALQQVMDYRGGYQPATGVTQKYGKTTHDEQDHKFNLSMRSSKLAPVSPAKNPRVALIKDLEKVLERWRSQLDKSPSRDADEVLLTMCEVLLLPLKEKTKDDQREAVLKTLGTVKSGFDDSGLPAPLYEKKPQVPQGPDVVPDGPTASGSAIGTADNLLQMVSEVSGGKAAVEGASEALGMIVAEPRPRDDDEHALLYTLAKSEFRRLAGALTTAHECCPEEQAMLKVKISQAKEWVLGMVSKFDDYKGMGAKIGTKNETARRDIIKLMTLECNIYFPISGDRVQELTGRKV